MTKPKADSVFRVMALGDIVGRPGRQLLQKRCGTLRKEFEVDLVLANGENAAGGLGLDEKTAREILKSGVDIISLGDHVWQRSEMEKYLESHTDLCIRPANYPTDAPGKGWCISEPESGIKVGIFNLIGRVFMQGALDCPFKAADFILDNHLSDCTITICDFHAEATSEKMALGRYLDGRCSLLFGTHTHVQTADEQILPKGTAFISDIGMCGSVNGVLGMKTELSLKRFLSGRKTSYDVAKGPARLNGIICDFDHKSGKALSIRRISVE